MLDVIWFRDLNIGQNAYRSPSVFNFYSADYQPSTAGFAEQQWVAPEAEILDVESLTSFSNIVRQVLVRNDIQSLDIRGQGFTRNAGISPSTCWWILVPGYNGWSWRWRTTVMEIFCV